MIREGSLNIGILLIHGVRMSTHKFEVKVAIATLILVGCTLPLFMATPAISLFIWNTNIPNTGLVNGIGVGVYWDAWLTNKVSSINWGVLDLGINVDKTVYIRNESNSVASLSMTTSNWSPSNASNYISLNWNYGGQTLNADQVTQVKLILSVSASIHGITNFSFDITIITDAHA